MIGEKLRLKNGDSLEIRLDDKGCLTVICSDCEEYGDIGIFCTNNKQDIIKLRDLLISAVDAL